MGEFRTPDTACILIWEKYIIIMSKLGENFDHHGDDFLRTENRGLRICG